MRYGLGDGRNYTLRQIAQVFRISRERVRQIEGEALKKLKQPDCSGQLSGFLEGPGPTIGN